MDVSRKHEEPTGLCIVHQVRGLMHIYTRHQMLSYSVVLCCVFGRPRSLARRLHHSVTSLKITVECLYPVTTTSALFVCVRVPYTMVGCRSVPAPCSYLWCRNRAPC